MVRDVEIGPSVSLVDLEGRLASMPTEFGDASSAALRIRLDKESHILVDVWLGILCGTLCRRAVTEVTFSEGRKELDASARFGSSLPGLVCASIAKSIRSEAGATFDSGALKQRIMLQNHGLVSPDNDVAQMLVEFDPDYPVSSLLRRRGGTQASPGLRRRLLESQVLHFRKMLDIGALRRGSGPVRAGPAGHIGEFLAQLHENGFEHGSRGVTGIINNGTRLLRMRTHAACDPQDLLERCGPFRQLARYVERTFRGTDPVTMVEACVSDFGLGIVDGFQASPAGIGPDADRRELLEGLVYGRLTSKSNDPSAGLGIQKALDAARRMQAFVSLRTSEFWMAASFLSDKPDARLVHLGQASHARVEGTHWQIFWPHY